MSSHSPSDSQHYQPRNHAVLECPSCQHRINATSPYHMHDSTYRCVECASEDKPGPKMVFVKGTLAREDTNPPEGNSRTSALLACEKCGHTISRVAHTPLSEAAHLCTCTQSFPAIKRSEENTSGD